MGLGILPWLIAVPIPISSSSLWSGNDIAATQEDVEPAP